MDKIININWGVRIAILYCSFVALIIFLVFRSSSEKVDLVSQDYYKQELAFQDKLDQINRANSLPQPVRWEVTDHSFIISFPATMNVTKGEIYLMRPSDKALDVKFAIKLDVNGKQSISKEQITPGAYKVMLSWEAEGEKYYKEGVIYLN
jgi:hypothetical protein